MSTINIRYSATTVTLAGLLMLAGCSKTEPASSPAAEAVQTSAKSDQPAAKPAVNPPAAPTETALNDARTPTSQDTSVPIKSADPQVVQGQLKGSPNAMPVQPITKPTTQVLRAEPSIVNLGEMATNETKTSILKLYNTSDEPVTIERAKTSCGCTTAGLEPGTVLGPGESVDVSISLRGGSRAQALSKTVSFLISGMDPLVVAVRGQTTEFVTMQPLTLDRDSNPEGIITLHSIDDQPFRVTGMSPPLLAANELPQEPSATQEIKFPWDRYDEYGLTRRITLHLDHPRAQSVFANVKVDNSQVLANNTNPRPAGNVAQNVAPKTGMALIDQMFKQNDTDGILMRLDEGLSLESKDNSGMTVLSLACRYADGAFVQKLIERGADIEAQDNAGRTPLMTAAQYSNISAMQALLDVGARINARDRIGNTPLSWASGFGSAEGVAELINNGAEIEAVSMVTGWTPLIWAAGFGEPASVQVLVSAGANLEVGDIMQGATPLINAARTGKEESISILLKAGAQIEAKDRNGKTALLAACENAGGTAEKVKILLDHNADVMATDNRGMNALQLAKARTDARAAAVIEILTPLFNEAGEQPGN